VKFPPSLLIVKHRSVRDRILGFEARSESICEVEGMVESEVMATKLSDRLVSAMVCDIRWSQVEISKLPER